MSLDVAATRWRLFLDQGYLQVLSSNVLLQLLGFGSVLLVAKFLPPDDLAIIRTAQAYAAVLVIVAGWGLTTPVLRYCADPVFSISAKRVFLGFALVRVVAVSLAVVICAGLAAFVLTDGPVAEVYMGYALAIPALAITSLFFVYLQARQEFGQLARSQTYIKLGSVAAIVLATWWSGLIGFVIAIILAAYLGLIPLFRVAVPVIVARTREYLPNDFSHMATVSMVGMLISALGQSADFILLEYAKEDRMIVGRYSLATIFLLAASTLTGSIQGVVTPKFTALLSTPAEFRSKLRSWTINTIMLSAAVACACLGAAWCLEQWFFSDGYRGFTEFLSVLMLKYVVWSAYAIAGAAMVGAGLIKIGTWIAMFTTTTAFVAGYFLILAHGAWGAAWTHVVIAGLSLMLVWWAQRTGLNAKFQS